MANTTTLYRLKERALDLADMTSSSFPDDDRLTDYINSGLSALHDILANSYGDYLTKTSTVALVSGTEDYTLPTDFFKLLKVFLLSGGKRYRVHRFSLDEIDGSDTSPSVTGTLQLWYIPQLTTLKEDTDTVSISIPVGWEEYVAIHAAIKLLQREESDPSMLMAERDRESMRIISMAAERDAGSPAQMGDYYNRWNSSRVNLIDNRNIRYMLSSNNIKVIELPIPGVA